MTGTVLLVDDDPIAANLFRFLLNRYDFDVIIADSVDKAIFELELQTPDIIICDFEMPVLDGLDLRKFLLKHSYWGEIPFVFLSACADPVFRLEAAFLDTPVYSKGISGELLVDVVKRKLNRSIT